MQNLRRNDQHNLGVTFRTGKHVWQFIDHCNAGTVEDTLTDTIIVTSDRPFKLTLHYYKEIRPTPILSKPYVRSIANDFYLDAKFPREVLYDMREDKHILLLGGIPLGTHVAIESKLYYVSDVGRLVPVPVDMISK